MGPRSEKLVFNSVLNFRRVTHFRLRLLETQVSPDPYNFNQKCMTFTKPDPQGVLTCPLRAPLGASSITYGF